MSQSSRIGNTLRNTSAGLIGQLFTYILTFAYRTVFIYTLGANYLGVQGLFSNILSLLSLAELGVGNAIIFSLYKPLADKNTHKIQMLMGFYAKIYRIIGCVVAVLGLALTPYLDYLIKDKPNIPHLTIIYLLFLADSVLSYFFAYKRSIIVADQKGYVNTINMTIFSFARNSVQIIWLLLFKSFIPVLIIQALSTLLSNIVISHKANKLYPFLTKSKNVEIDPETKVDLSKKIRAMMYHKIGSVVVLGTDNLLISSFVGIYWVGIYSNYVMIIGMVTTFIQQFSQALVASIGNLVSTETTVKAKETFDLLYFLNFWIYAFCTICFMTLFNPFITVWIGTEYLFNRWIVLIIVVNFYISGMRQNVLSFRNSLGLFWYDRYKPIAEALINLVASIVLLKYWGIAGVFLGTLISTVTTSLWVEPYILFKHYFKSGLISYFKKYILYLAITLSLCFIMQAVQKCLFDGSILSLIGLFAACLIVPNCIICLLFFRTDSYRTCIDMIWKILHDGLKKV